MGLTLFHCAIEACQGYTPSSPVPSRTIAQNDSSTQHSAKRGKCAKWQPRFPTQNHTQLKRSRNAANMVLPGAPANTPNHSKATHELRLNNERHTTSRAQGLLDVMLPEIEEHSETDNDNTREIRDCAGCLAATSTLRSL
jgi:hypothetical protein